MEWLNAILAVSALVLSIVGCVFFYLSEKNLREADALIKRQEELAELAELAEQANKQRNEYDVRIMKRVTEKLYER